MYGLLANVGRREDHSSLGGQVAHISAAEADLLRRLGGAASINPVTGLPEYYTSGVGGPGSTGATGGPGGVAASSPGPGSGIGAATGGPFGFTASLGPSSPGTTGTGSAVAPAAVVNAIAQNPTMYGVEGPGGIGDGSPGPASSATGNFGIVTTTDGTPVTTTDGVPVMHGNLSGRVANTAIIPSDIANAQFFNQLGEATDGIPNMMLAFFSQMAQAQTPQNVANTRGAMALAGPGMGAPSASFGGGPAPEGLLPSQQVANLPQGGLLPTQADLNQIIEERQAPV